jgi:hypothetical protein
MATEFTVVLTNTPGTLATLAGILGDARVNIDAIQGTSGHGASAVRLLADEPDRAGRALDAAGVIYTTREVVVVRVLDMPGMLSDVALVMAEAGINIDSIYLTTTGHVVLGVDDVGGAVEVASGMAVMRED